MGGSGYGVSKLEQQLGEIRSSRKRDADHEPPGFMKKGPFAAVSVRTEVRYQPPGMREEAKMEQPCGRGITSVVENGRSALDPLDRQGAVDSGGSLTRVHRGRGGDDWRDWACEGMRRQVRAGSIWIQISKRVILVFFFLLLLLLLLVLLALCSLFSGQRSTRYSTQAGD